MFAVITLIFISWYCDFERSKDNKRRIEAIEKKLGIYKENI